MTRRDERRMRRVLGSAAPRRFEARAVAEWVAGRGWVALLEVPPARAARPNFVIVCDHGDWSGFRTLAACLAQVMEYGRPVGYYRIEER